LSHLRPRPSARKARILKAGRGQGEQPRTAGRRLSPSRGSRGPMRS
jgi:hypothetical protein